MSQATPQYEILSMKLISIIEDSKKLAEHEQQHLWKLTPNGKTFELMVDLASFCQRKFLKFEIKAGNGDFPNYTPLVIIFVHNNQDYMKQVTCKELYLATALETMLQTVKEDFR